MKRKIVFVITLALSFLMMFASVAMANEIVVPIPNSTAETSGLEVVQIPAVKVNQTDLPSPQASAKQQVLKAEKPTSVGLQPLRSCNVYCGGGRYGYWDVEQTICIPCDN